MNIGVFGGTFNPPHCGHLIIAERVREEFGLDKVLFVPSSVSPHKQHLALVDPAHRLEMVQLAVLGQQHFESSSIEIDRGGVSYTIDTLEELGRIYSDAVLYLLVGMDNLGEFATWKSPERIVDLAKVVVMTRPGFHPTDNPEQLPRQFLHCQVPKIEISSSEIRERVRDGKSIRYLVPTPVESYIYFRRLYR